MSNHKKKFDLEDRDAKVESKERKIFPDLEAEKILNQFDSNIKSITNKYNIYDNLVQHDLKEEADDVLRSQIVFLMSSVDYYMHEIAKYCFVKIFNNEKEETDKFKEFMLSIATVKEAMKNPASIDWLSEEIIVRQSKKTFMACDPIKNLLKQISKKKIYQIVANNHFNGTKALDNFFKEVYKRRNVIAHQFDREHGEEELQHIDKVITNRYIDGMELFINEVHKLIVSDV